MVKKAVILSIPREPTAEELAALQSESDERYSSPDEETESYKDRRGNGSRRRHDRDDQGDDVGGEDEGPILYCTSA